jgi:hypothetical protein
MLCLKALKRSELILLSQVLWQNYLLLKQLWIQQSKRFKFMVVMGVAEYHVERMMRDAKITKYMRERQ